MTYYFKRDYVKALESLRQADEVGPALSTTWEIGIYVQNGLFSEALAEAEEVSATERREDNGYIYSFRRQPQPGMRLRS